MRNRKWCVAVLIAQWFVSPAHADEGLAQSQKRLAESLTTLRERIRILEAKPDWPRGKYCIFRSGTCPVGFTQSDGRLAGIWMYRGGDSGTHLLPMEFGNSGIVWHDRDKAPKGGNWWHGELNFSACCKQK